jgi:putative transposase
MPWKKSSLQEQRYELIRAMGAGRESLKRLCQRIGISRKTAYKWRRRYRCGRLGSLVDQSRRPHRQTTRTQDIWLRRLRQWRRRRPTWGVRKLRYGLEQQFGRAGLPSGATLGRWLRRWGLAKGRRRRSPGPAVARPPVQPAGQNNEVWTVDFKGWYRTGDGSRVDPLTVRDLYSRYGLAILLLQGQGIAETQKAFVKIFRKYGLPRRIRSDNGAPFGGGGPTGLTRLSAWWVKLGIAVEFITPGRPCENGSHEQFHRVYKAEVAREPFLRPKGQQGRSHEFLWDYHHRRPHEGLGLKVPASVYRKSSRPLPRGKRPWNYPAGWSRRWVKGNGEITWQGRRRFTGEAFARDYVGLEPKRPGTWWVYFGPVLIGELDEKETGNLRPVRPLPARLVERPHSGSLRSPP